MKNVAHALTCRARCSFSGRTCTCVVYVSREAKRRWFGVSGPVRIQVNRTEQISFGVACPCMVPPDLKKYALAAASEISC
jgi:hypothetical protein